MDRQAGSLKLVHYSGKLIKKLESRPQQIGQFILHTFDKPNGFWVSVEGDDGWEEWCRRNKYLTSKLKRIYDVKLNKDAKILLIKNEKQFDRFEEEFESKNPELTFGIGIDWAEVSKRYQGILIIPYLWSKRLGHFWYYGWDCASGCIWDISAIESISLREKPKKL